MERDEAIRLLSGFINLHTFDDESGNRELYHDALSVLENKSIRYDNAKSFLDANQYESKMN